MKVAIVHYWLVGMRGGEKVVEILCDMFPQADIFTLVADEAALSPTIRKHRITTSFLQKIGGRKHYQKMLPLMPFALEAFDLTDYDLIISSEAGPAKGIIPRPDALHICYCHSPMRYIWDLYPQYRSDSGWLTRRVLSATAPLLRQWDVTTAARVDHFIANSDYVAKRIEKFYRRPATVIHPPVDVSRFNIKQGEGEYYICAGQITPYKRIDIAVEAFTRMNKPLLVIGSGATEDLKRRSGPSIRFVGAVSDAEMEDYFSRCKALIYPGVEDYGIVPLEVMASGRPVIAFGRGGVLETVREGNGGIIFEEQTAAALINAVEEFERAGTTYDRESLRAFAVSKDKGVFRKELAGKINELMVQAGMKPVALEQ